jgi:hypothetical protein
MIDWFDFENFEIYDWPGLGRGTRNVGTIPFLRGMIVDESSIRIVKSIRELGLR